MIITTCIIIFTINETGYYIISMFVTFIKLYDYIRRYKKFINEYKLVIFKSKK